jgi:predicted RNA-binding protein with PIN domain
MAKKVCVVSASQLQQRIIYNEGSILKFARKIEREQAISESEIGSALARARNLLDIQRRLQLKLAENRQRMQAMAAE